MYRLINLNAAAIVRSIDRIGDVSAYIRLRSSFLAGVDIGADRDFQRLYSSYWRMNVARLSEAFYSRYFALLGECRHSGSSDVARIVQHLSDTGGVSRGLQFSFATKLAHMADPRLPVYDSFVAGFYFYVHPLSGNTPAERIRSLLDFYELPTEGIRACLRTWFALRSNSRIQDST